MNGNIKLIAPVCGACPVCAARHKRDEAHDAESFYFMARFYAKNRRLPTAADAREKDGKAKATAGKEVRG
jgi:hypothetical protein